MNASLILNLLKAGCAWNRKCMKQSMIMTIILELVTEYYCQQARAALGAYSHDVSDSLEVHLYEDGNILAFLLGSWLSFVE